MSEQPQVSVVMSTYNDAMQLGESIESVMAQSFSQWEMIIVNDGSPDPRTMETLNRYAAKDARVRVIDKDNEGLTRALIRGCSEATGRLIARMDVGDVMRPERLTEQAGLLDARPECVLVASATEFCGPAWEPLWITKSRATQTPDPSAEQSTDEAAKTFDISHHGAAMFRTADYLAVGGYRWAFYYGQDWDLWYRLSEQGQVAALDAAHYAARLFPDSISMQHSARQRAIARCSWEASRARKRGESDADWLAEAAKIRPAKKGSTSTTIKPASDDGYYFIGEALRRTGHPAARRYLWKALKLGPFRLRNYVRIIQVSLAGIKLKRPVNEA